MMAKEFGIPRRVAPRDDTLRSRGRSRAGCRRRLFYLQDQSRRSSQRVDRGRVRRRWSGLRSRIRASVLGPVRRLATGDRRGGGGHDESQTCGMDSVHALRSFTPKRCADSTGTARRLDKYCRFLAVCVPEFDGMRDCHFRKCLIDRESVRRSVLVRVLIMARTKKSAGVGVFRHSGKGGIGRFPPCFCARIRAGRARSRSLKRP